MVKKVFRNANITFATIADIPALLRLLNSAYRGETSKQGWTSEAHLIAGEQRTDAASVKEIIERTGSVLLKYTDEQNRLIGCVNLQQHDKRIYLGMLSVSPALQGGGIGKKLLAASEEYTTSVGCQTIYMTVISVREELINWYKRHGYVDTGERKPFKEDAVTGKHLRQLDFIVLEKKLS